MPVNGVFVFGANPQFRHGKGAALHAVKHCGAVYGKGGLQGQSFTIITKELRSNYPKITKADIISNINDFYLFAAENPQLKFFVCYAGTGTNLNYFTPLQMAEMFFRNDIPVNIFFKESFYKLMTNKKEFTFDDLEMN